MQPNAESAQPVSAKAGSFSPPIQTAPADQPIAPVPVTIITSSNTNPSATASAPKRKSPLKILLFLLVLLGLIMIPGLGVSGYFVATDIIDLGNPQLQQTITKAVIAFPLIPKNPALVLKSSTLAHQELTQSSFDLLVSAESKDLEVALGQSATNLRFAGYVDYSDSENPRFTMSVDFGEAIGGQVIKNDPVIYFKIDRFPLNLLQTIGITQQSYSLITESWVSFDTAPLAAQAKKTLQSNPSSDSSDTETAQKVLRKVFETDILPQVKQSTESLDGISTYKLTYSPTNEQLDTVYTKIQAELMKALPNSAVTSKNQPLPSEYISNPNLSLWFSQKDGYLVKLALNASYDPTQAKNSQTVYGKLPSSPVTLSVVSRLSDFGKVLPITPPATSFTYEELIKKIYELQTPASSSALATPSEVIE